MRQEVWVTSQQERQLAACEPLMADEPLISLHIVHSIDDLEAPLEKGRIIYKTLTLGEVLEILAWKDRTGYKVMFGCDADGREYVQY